MGQLAIVSRLAVCLFDFQVLENYASPEYIAQVKEFQVAMPAVDLSSSEIRQKTAYGKSIRYHLPRSVEQYIRQEQLYQLVIESANLLQTSHHTQSRLIQTNMPYLRGRQQSDRPVSIQARALSPCFAARSK